MLALNHGASIVVTGRGVDSVPLLGAGMFEFGWRFQDFDQPEEAQVERFILPGLSALNFVLYNCLDGGASQSRKYDPQGKTYAQILLNQKLKGPASYV